MAKPKVELNSAAVGRLLKSKEVQAELAKRTGRAAAAAGDGYRAEVTVGRTRALGMVRAESAKARRDNAQNHTLMRARDEMR